MNVIRTQKIGRFIVSMLDTGHVTVARKPEAKDNVNALKDGNGNIPMVEIKSKFAAGFNAGRKKAKTYDAIDHPEQYPARYNLILKLAELEKVEPAAFYSMSDSDLTKMIKNHKN